MNSTLLRSVTKPRPIVFLFIRCRSLVPESLMDLFFPFTLTTLNIVAFHMITFSIVELWEQCRFLEILRIASGTNVEVFDAWVPPGHNRANPFPLRALTLSHVFVNQHNFEDFLELTPQLTELKLVGLFSRLCSSVHLQSQTYIDTRQRLIDACSGSTEWSFFPAEITPILLQELVALPNVITSLDLSSPFLLNQGNSFCLHYPHAEAVRLLHQYLCDSPHLLHLKTIRGAAFLEDMDICGRLLYADLDLQVIDDPAIPASRSAPRPVWSCHNLRTLQIEIHGHDYNFEISAPGLFSDTSLLFVPGWRSLILSQDVMAGLMTTERTLLDMERPCACTLFNSRAVFVCLRDWNA
ncbi:hypothetical protein BG015_010510 [Linnemannia schmuckeri]|uniref:F-box domain-containing protein n=1 Tax=Linnemannia schmuckeri TaxID=64567 RepID=A0A9P5V908_9FUNG|nr:hypothetical protein BG015_010510 [Linnemannia schmuckeri]